ncbi:hypothetical protein C8R47DRAFT_1225487 [Mycena vitilis]|nr:hypothetical protein C8R47DRAFT_1227063 [Mycena vitilis]KAJ6462336.1 hypothetical protein C8R47DRAFT_1225487 [Mycena vitilis]
MEPSPLSRLDFHVEMATQCLTLAHASIANWTTLGIACSTPAVMTAIISVLSTVDAHRLNSLFITSPSSTDNSNDCCTLFKNPFRIFLHAPTGLRSLYLIEAVLRWGDPHCFGTVNALHVRQLNSSYWPNRYQFVSTLTAACNLTSLLLDGGGVTPSISVATPFTLQNLRSLTIMYEPQTESYLTVLSAGTFPMLTKFTAHGMDSPGWNKVMDLAFFQALTHLVIAGKESVQLTTMNDMFSRLVNLTTIDVSYAADTWFAALAKNARFCAGLEELVLNSPCLADMREYATSRDLLGYTTIRNVRIRFALNDSREDENHVALRVIAGVMGSLHTSPTAY